jgi:ABC-type glycerol-3-phosphate transport system substrate-binding protein
VPYLGGAGWLAVVPVTAPHPEAAFDLLAELTGPARSAQAVMEPRWGGGPFRIDQLQRDRWDAFDLDGQRSRDLREAVSRTLWQHGIKNPVLCLRIPDQATHRDRLVSGLQRILGRKEGTPKDVLAEVAREWAELDRRKGQGRALADYRLSVGLLQD